MRNIPRELRWEIKPEGLDGMLAQLYNGPVKEIKTKRGEWRIHTRTGLKMPLLEDESGQPLNNGFCAVFYRKGEPVTMVSGETDSNLEGKINQITRKVVEQPLLRRPLLYFDADSSPGPLKVYLGLLASAIGGAMYLIVSNPMSHLPLIIPAISLTIIPAKMFSNAIGRRADAARAEGLPEGFKYGPEAMSTLISERANFDYQKQKISAYEEEAAKGLKTSREEFSRIYDIGGQKTVSQYRLLNESKK